MAADVLGQGIDHHVRAVEQRLLPQGPEEGVVDGDGRTVLPHHGIARLRHGFDIDQRVGGVGRAFEVDQRQLAAILRGLRLALF